MNVPTRSSLPKGALAAFFAYFGSKGRISLRLPPPRYGQIVEAFAGSARYACLHPDQEVTLCDRNPTIAALWRWLIRVSPAEVSRIPLLRGDQSLDNLGPVAPEARTLVGLWLGKGDASPRLRPSSWAKARLDPENGSGLPLNKWMREVWCEAIRVRIASQVERIRHWQVVEGSYTSLPNHLATWIVDPPYQGDAGRTYPCGSDELDFAHLAGWTRKRNGLVVVHEGPDATWFPEAKIVGDMNSHNGAMRSMERIACFDTLRRETVAVRMLLGNISRARRLNEDDLIGDDR